MIPDDLWHQIRHEIDGQLVFRTEDEWGELFVVDHAGRRHLYFGAPYEQSCIDLQQPWQPVHEYARSMMLVLALHYPRTVTMLGLGGGSLLHAVHRAIPDATATVIEQRQAVVAIAREFFQLEEGRHTDILLDDAKVRLRTLEPGSCDLLFADLFTDQQMHPWQQQHKFFSQCRRHLRDDGWLVINFDELQPQGGRTLDALMATFPFVLGLATRDGNHVILACAQAQIFEPEHHLQDLHQLQERLGVDLLPLYQRLELLSP